MTVARQIAIGGFISCIAGVLVFRAASGRLRETLVAQNSIEGILAASRGQIQRANDQLAAICSATKPTAPASSPPKSAPLSSGSQEFGSPSELDRQARQSRANIALRFAPLYQDLHLAAEESAQITAWYAAFEIHRDDILEAARQQGLTRQNPAIEAMIAQQTANLEVAISGILGPDGLAQWREFQLTQSVRTWEENLAADLYDTAAPFRPDQAAQLTPLLSSLHQTASDGEESWDPATVDAGRLQGSAATVLSPVQMERLRALTEDHRIAAQLQELMAQWQAAHQSGPGP